MNVSNLKQFFSILQNNYFNLNLRIVNAQNGGNSLLDNWINSFYFNFSNFQKKVKSEKGKKIIIFHMTIIASF
jgi:hypothetical protein